VSSHLQCFMTLTVAGTGNQPSQVCLQSWRERDLLQVPLFFGGAGGVAEESIGDNMHKEPSSATFAGWGNPEGERDTSTSPIQALDAPTPTGHPLSPHRASFQLSP